MSVEILRVHEHPEATEHYRGSPHEGCQCRVCKLTAERDALVRAARNFAARVEERNPEWFREGIGSTDFSEADHALRVILAIYPQPTSQGEATKGGTGQ